MSGRSLRRLPVLAHARYIGSLSMLGPRTLANGTAARNGGRSHGGETDVGVWLDAMERVVESQAMERERFGK